MKREKLPELDILRIVSLLIVIVVIHLKDYGHSFLYDLDLYGVFYFNGLGIFVAMGSFVFISGFGLYLNQNNRKINCRERLIPFLKKRFFRIFPLYWIAIPLFMVFVGYMNIDPLYLFFHFLGLQMIVAPIFGFPMLTLWFIGIIVIYYLIYLVLSFIGSLKGIIPASIAILFLFVYLNVVFGLVEYRFFYYYLFFIAGIVCASFYTSDTYNRIKEHLKRRLKILPIVFSLILAIVFFFLYQTLAEIIYSYFTSEYGTFHLREILDQNNGFFQSTEAVLLINLIISVYIIFTISLFYLFIRIMRLITKLISSKFNVDSLFSIVAYSTFSAYLFHRIFLVIYSYLLNNNLGIETFNPDNSYLRPLTTTFRPL